MSNRDKQSSRAEFYYFSTISTRWMDNDIYGHVNNVVYYSFFDSVANKFLIEKAGLDIHNAPIIGLVVASNCQYSASIAFPEVVEVGFRVNRLGNSSVEYAMGVFKQGKDLAAAFGTFTHVFVDRQTNQSVAIPRAIRTALEKVTVPN